MSNIGKRQMEFRSAEFKTREAEDGTPIIEGYFAVFGSDYNIAPGMSESVDPGAFDNTLGNDIRALVNHDTTLVLGRTKSNTLELKTDSHGLFGRIRINTKDSDAMNLYERVSRGDVDGCSFGFDIRDEETDLAENGDVHWTIKDVDLFEVSCCTFPAYEQTNISARMKQKEDLEERKAQAWRERMTERIKNHAENSNEKA